MDHTVKRDGLVEQVSARSPLHLDHDVTPSVVLRPTRHACRNPFLIDITVDVPLVTASNTAFVAPDIALPAGELIDVKLDRLRVRGRRGIEIYVVYEITSTIRERVVVVRETHRRKRPDQMVVPQEIRVWAGATNVVFGGVAVEGRRTVSGRPVPIHRT